MLHHWISRCAGAPRRIAQIHVRVLSDVPANRRVMFDTLAFSTRLIDAGVSEQEARAIAVELAAAMHKADSIYNSELASKAELARATDQQNNYLEQLKSEMRSEQDAKRANLEKLRTELRYEIDKLTGSQKLDLNLERGRTRDEIAKQNDRIMSIDGRLDREVNLIRTQIEASKNDMLRYSVATLASLGAVTLGAIRLMLYGHLGTVMLILVPLWNCAAEEVRHMRPDKGRLHAIREISESHS
jgi:hypothetical protein